MSVADYFPVVQLLYIAYFGRPADPAGQLRFAQWLHDLGAATDVTGLSKQYSQPGNDALRTLVDSLGDSAESARLYASADTESFVRAVFSNVLDRQPLSNGLAYWVGDLDAGRVTRGQAALSIMAGAFSNTTNPTTAGFDQKTILNKLEVASHFTGLLDTQAKRDAYRGAVAASHTRALLEEVDYIASVLGKKWDAEDVVKRLSGEGPGGDTTMLISSQPFTGSAQSERVAVGATYRLVAMGEGDDTVVLTKPNLGYGGTVDGGAGVDTLVMSASHASKYYTATKPAEIRGFERLELVDVFYDDMRIDRLGDIAHVVLRPKAPSKIDWAVLDGVMSGAAIEVDSQSVDLTVRVREAASGQNDVLTLAAVGNKPVSIGKVKVDHVETIHLISSYPDPGNYIEWNRASLLAPDTKALTLRGDGPIKIELTGTALTSFDASAFNGTLEFFVPALAGAISVKGGAGHNNIGLWRTSNGADYLGGAGSDHVSGGPSTQTISTGAGDDTVVLDQGASVVDLGGGNDMLVVERGGVNLVRGGAGTDAFYFNRYISSNATTLTTIADIEAGEQIRFPGSRGADALDQVGPRLSLQAGSTLEQYLDAAAAGTKPGALRWFVIGGSTYLVADRSSAATFVEGVDTVVKLVGVHDVSGASVSADGMFQMPQS